MRCLIRLLPRMNGLCSASIHFEIIFLVIGIDFQRLSLRRSLARGGWYFILAVEGDPFSATLPVNESHLACPRVVNVLFVALLSMCLQRCQNSQTLLRERRRVLCSTWRCQDWLVISASVYVVSVGLHDRREHSRGIIGSFCRFSSFDR